MPEPGAKAQHVNAHGVNLAKCRGGAGASFVALVKDTVPVKEVTAAGLLLTGNGSKWLQKLTTNGCKCLLDVLEHCLS